MRDEWLEHMESRSGCKSWKLVFVSVLATTMGAIYAAVLCKFGPIHGLTYLMGFVVAFVNVSAIVWLTETKA